MSLDSVSVSSTSSDLLSDELSCGGSDGNKSLESSGVSVSSSEFEFDEDPMWPPMDIPGTWGTYGLENKPWDDNFKPMVKMNVYGDLQLNCQEKEGVLTDRILAAGSSYLDRCPETGKYVICKITLIHKNLSDISLIKYHHYLQFLNLSYNNLMNLEALGELPFLMYLDVSHNNLMELLDFKPPFNLTYVNYSNNHVTKLPNLSDFWSIVNLNLSHNHISEINGLDNLRFLRFLDLSNNEIEILENLNHLRLLKLNLEHNRITHSRTKLNTMDHLIFVNLNHNRLKSLSLFKNCVNLQSISVICNKIESFMEITHLEGCIKLTLLDLRDNPIVHLSNYVDAVLVINKKLLVLDGMYLDTMQKISAKESFIPFNDKAVSMCHANLYLLEQLSFPLIKTPVILSEPSPVPIVILVGLPACGTHLLMSKIKEKYEDRVQVGVNHTTRDRVELEVEGEDYYYVKVEEFIRMVKIGDFLTASQHLGNYFGLSQQELYKASMDKRILLLHMDLNGATCMRMRGLQPKLILAMPRTPQIHRALLEQKYCYSSPSPTFCSSLYRHSESEQWSFSSNITQVKNSACAKMSSSRNYFTPSSAEESVQNIVKDIMEDILEKITRTKSTHKLSINLLEQTQYSEGPIRTRASLDDQEMLYDTSTETLSDSFNQLISEKDGEKVTTLMENKGNILAEKSSSSAEIIDTSNVMSKQSILKRANKAKARSKKTSKKLSVTFSLLDANTFFSPINSDTDIQIKELSPIVTSSNSNDEFTPDLNITNETSENEYEKDTQTAPDMEYEILDGTLSLFHANVLNSRMKYLEKHHSNPGFFCDTIFTNEIESAMIKLERVFKEGMRDQTLREKRPQRKIKEEEYAFLAESRLNKLVEELNKTSIIK